MREQRPHPTPIPGHLYADADSLQLVPEDFDYVLNFAVVKSGDFNYDLAANAEGVGNMMTRCRNARAFPSICIRRSPITTTRCMQLTGAAG
jgi:hypothetical protein